MTITPHLRVDTDDWPEIVPTLGPAISKVAEIMQIFSIQSVRRYRKTGPVGVPATRDAVVRMKFYTPKTIEDVSQRVGSAILDLVEAFGLEGVSLSLTDGDYEELGKYWEHYGEPPSTGNTVSEEVDLSGPADDGAGAVSEGGDQDGQDGQDALQDVETVDLGEVGNGED